MTPEAWRPLVHGNHPEALRTGHGPLSPRLVREIERGLGVAGARESGDVHLLVEEAEGWIYPRLISRLEKARKVSSSFLAVTFTRLLDDFRDHAFGTHNPPAEVARLGGPHLAIFRHLCQQRLAVSEVIAILDIEFGIELKEAMQLVAEVRSLTRRTGCGRAPPMEADPEEVLAGIADDALNDPAERAAEREKKRDRQDLLLAVRDRLRLTDQDMARLLAMGDHARHHPPTEAIVLHLCFVLDYSCARIAPMLGLPEKTVQRIREDGLARFREAFAERILG